MTAKIPELKFDASSLPVDQQFAGWAGLVSRYEVETMAPEKGFIAVATAWLIGPVVVTLNQLGPVKMRRTAATIRSDNVDHYCMIMLLDGAWSGDIDGQRIAMGTDDICMMDLSRPIDCQSGASTSITLLMPRLMLDEVVAPFDLHGLVLSAGAGALLSDYVKALVRRLLEIDADDAGQIALATRDHLAATLMTIRGKLAQPVNSAVLARAKRFISANLGGDLSAAAICKELKISRSNLYRVFETLGGVASYVQERRLAKAHAELGRPGELRSIAEIAYSVGFTSSAHFYRQFHKTYGYTASERRERAERVLPPLPSIEEPQPTYRDWSHLLAPAKSG